MTERLSDYMTHEEFRIQICDLAHHLGYKVHWIWKSYHSPKGMLDLTLCKPPRLIFAELKVKKDKPTPDQIIWHDLLVKCYGVEAYFWRPEDFLNIKDTLEGNL